MTFLIITCLNVVLVAMNDSPADGSHGDNNADKVVREFVARQQADLPVTGTFVVRTVYSDQWKTRRKQEIRDKYTKDGMDIEEIYRMENWEPLLVCEWSYDGMIEVLKAKSEGNEMVSFYRSKESYITSAENQFQIRDVKHGMPNPAFRPYNFYYGISDTWIERMAKAKNMQIIMNNKYGGATVVISSEHGKGKTELHLHLDAKYRLHQYEYYDNGILIGKLEINDMYVDGLKAFPKRAKLTITMPRDKNEYVERILEARNISFPANRVEMSPYLSFPVPIHAHLFDHQLKQQGYVARDADIQEVLDKKVPLLNMVDTSTPLPPLPKGWPAWAWLTLGAGLACLLLLAGWLYYRHRKLSGLTG